MIDCRGSCSFLQRHLSFHFCYPLPVSSNPAKRALFQTAICRRRRWPPPLTVFPQREPLHRRRELCNHTKTDFFLVLIWWSYYQLAWGLGVLKTASPPKWPGFASLEVTRAMFSLYMPQGAPARRGFSGSGHCRPKRS